MIIKETIQKKNKSLNNININNNNIKTHHLYNFSKNKNQNKKPAFQMNKSLKKYIYNNTERNNTNPKLINKNNDKRVNNIKIRVNKKYDFSKTNKKNKNNNSPKSKDNDFIYYKKNSQILLFLKNNKNEKNGNIFNTKKTCYFNHTSFKNKFNEYTYNILKNDYKSYNDNFKKSSTSTYSSTISYREINNYNYYQNNKNELPRPTLGPITLSKSRMKCSLSPRTPYRKVGNIFNRNECQFSKIKNNNHFYLKDKLLKKNKSDRYFSVNLYNIYKKQNIDDEENDNDENIDKIKQLEGENIYLKNMIKLSEEKLTKRENQLEKLLMMHNEIEKKTHSIPFVKKFDSKILEIIKNKENINYNSNNKNKINKKNLKGNILDGIILYDYLDEPLEQVAPQPYNLKYFNNHC